MINSYSCFFMRQGRSPSRNVAEISALRLGALCDERALSFGSTASKSYRYNMPAVEPIVGTLATGAATERFLSTRMI